VTHFGGTAGTFSSGRPEVNTTHAAGTAWASGAINAAVFAADAITAAKLHADVTTELQAGLATSSAVSTLQTSVDDLPTNAELATSQAAADDATLAAIAALTIPTATENADALLNRDMSAVSDTEDRSPLNALRFLRNKWSISGTTLTVTKENDSTSAWTATVTAAPGADPISGSDPT
jgi:hypothetical protein